MVLLNKILRMSVVSRSPGQETSVVQSRQYFNYLDAGHTAKTKKDNIEVRRVWKGIVVTGNMLWVSIL